MSTLTRNTIKYIRQLDQKKYRRREGLFVAEGPKAVGDLMRNVRPRQIFATTEWFNSCHIPINELAEEVCEVTEGELERISFLRHPQQVLALFPILDDGLHESDIDVNGLSLVLDGIQDPGNLGTIIRIADWFGIQTVFCSEDTVDAWNPKVVQATMGSIAHVRVIYCHLPSLFDMLPEGFPIYGTFLDGNDIYQQELTAHGLIVMGNEGNGITPGTRERVNCRLLIPCFRQGETAESLNVAIATAITCSEFCRRKG